MSTKQVSMPKIFFSIVPTCLNYRHFPWGPIFLSFSRQRCFSSSMAFKPHQFRLNQFPFLKCEFGFKRKRWKHKTKEPISSSRTTQQKNPHSQSLFSNHNNNYSFESKHPKSHKPAESHKVTNQNHKLQILTTLNQNHSYTAESSTQINNTHVFRTKIQPTHHTNSIQNHHAHKPQKNSLWIWPGTKSEPSKHPHKGSFFFLLSLVLSFN